MEPMAPPAFTLESSWATMEHFDKVTSATGQAVFVVYRWSKTAPKNVGAAELWMGAWTGEEELLAAMGYTLAEARPAVVDNTPVKAIWRLGVGLIWHVDHPRDTTPWTVPNNVLSQFRVP